MSGPMDSDSEAGSTPMIGGETGTQVSSMLSAWTYQSYPFPE